MSLAREPTTVVAFLHQYIELLAFAIASMQPFQVDYTLRSPVEKAS
jgi:hypothetical protein